MSDDARFGRPGNDPRIQGPNDELSINHQIAQLCRRVPMFVRFILWTSIAIYLLSFPFPFVVGYTINIPYLVIQRYELWRLFTAPFSNTEILRLIFGLWAYLPRAIEVERMKGTTKFIIYFLWLSFISQVLMTLAVFLINLYMYFPSISAGLWSMALVDITIDSMKDPEMLQNLCCLPIKIKSKYFPYIYLIIFGLLFQSEFCALLGGFLAGMLYSTGMLKFTDPSRTCIAKVNSTILRPFVNYPSFAKEYDGVGFHVIAPSQHNIPASGDPQANNNRSAQPVSAFAGRGVVVGTERLINQPPAETANAIQYIREA